jgi:hypothetical protein
MIFICHLPGNLKRLRFDLFAPQALINPLSDGSDRGIAVIS